MNQILISVLNMSLTGTFVIAAIMLARIPLKRAPKIISYVLWAVAGFRLLIPFTVESVFSLIPFSAKPIPPDIAAPLAAQPQFYQGTGIAAGNVIGTASDVILNETSPVNPVQALLAAGVWVWVAGVIAMLAYSIISLVLLKRGLSDARLVGENVFEADNLRTPFVVGVFRPKIYIPAGLSDEEKRYVILHEQTHILRRDHLAKMLAYVILSVHWFNPLVWAAFLLMGADMEMSCDERVLKQLGGDIKKSYSLTLLSFATGKRIIAGSPLAFGEGGNMLKERIGRVLRFKKRSRIVIIAAAALAVALSLGFAVNRTDNYNKKADINIPEVTVTAEPGATVTAKSLNTSYTTNGGVGVVITTDAAWQTGYSDGNTLTVNLAADLIIKAPDCLSLDGGYIYAENGDKLEGYMSYMYDSPGGGELRFEAPREAGVYFCGVTAEYSENDLRVEYGFKVIVTANGSADEIKSRPIRYFLDEKEIFPAESFSFYSEGDKIQIYLDTAELQSILEKYPEYADNVKKISVMPQNVTEYYDEYKTAGEQKYMPDSLLRYAGLAVQYNFTYGAQTIVNFVKLETMPDEPWQSVNEGDPQSRVLEILGEPDFKFGNTWQYPYMYDKGKAVEFYFKENENGDIVVRRILPDIVVSEMVESDFSPFETTFGKGVPPGLPPADAPPRLSFISPLADGIGEITAVFGQDADGQPYSEHFGTDIAAPLGTPVFAAEEGVVTEVGGDGYNDGYGQYVVVKHPNGLSTAYAHCGLTFVSVGDDVKRGQTIALVGESGFAAGPHLHFEVRDHNGEYLDPSDYIGALAEASPKATGLSNSHLQEKPFIAPIESGAGYISAVGEQAGGYAGHTGVDFAAPKGTPILAAGDGTVTLANDAYSGYGRAVMIAHPNGLTTLSAHCDELLVKEGDVVKQGQTIARVGATGWVVGYVVHLEVRDGEEQLNPLDYVDTSAFMFVPGY